MPGRQPRRHPRWRHARTVKDRVDGHVGTRGGTIRTARQPDCRCMRHQCRVVHHNLAPCLPELFPVSIKPPPGSPRRRGVMLFQAQTLTTLKRSYDTDLGVGGGTLGTPTHPNEAFAQVPIHRLRPSCAPGSLPEA
ncbi:hypothetical protein B296_00052309 [Ensete ventricosum]|uniref:Uncharacterized protein n=1 Tax=Ensete ventricosum TaxID=4639 RepID=A0A426YD16_ENSVE|nr:hypothetical protein B296_00052309 [Ensete ventricosum]